MPALSLLPQTPSLQSSLLGGVFGLGLFMLVYLLSRGHLGMGDVKLAGLIGLMLGYPSVISVLMLGIILGAVAAIGLLVVLVSPVPHANRAWPMRRTWR